MSKTIDLTGQKFDKLTVIKRMKNYISPKGKIKTQWLCECDCGGENSLKIVLSCHLKSGHTKSCGCLVKEALLITQQTNRKYNTYDLSGEYGIGYTSKGEEFYFDLEDYDKIKNYYWRINNEEYVISLDENNVTIMHRLVTNCPRDMEVDHIFHKNFDNRKSELRIVTHSQNSKNKSLFSNNTSGVSGVFWNKAANKWETQIKVNYKTIYLGSFDNKEDAIEVRKQAEIEYFGEYQYKTKTIT